MARKKKNIGFKMTTVQPMPNPVKAKVGKVEKKVKATKTSASAMQKHMYNRLSKLLDTKFNNLQPGDVVIWDATINKWVNLPGGTGGPDKFLQSANTSGADLNLVMNDTTVVTVDLTTLVTDLITANDVYVASGVVAGSDLTLTMSDSSTVIIDVSTLVGGGGTISAVTNNLDGTYTHSDGQTIPTLTLIDTNAASNPYNNATSGLTAINVQAAIDELKVIIDNLAGATFEEERFVSSAGQTTFTLTSTPVSSNAVFVSNDSGQFVKGNIADDYTVSGNDVIFNTGQLSGDIITVKYVSTTGALAGNTSSVTDNLDGSYTHDDGTGNLVDIDTKPYRNRLR